MGSPSPRRQRHADEDQKAQREHFHRGVAVDERADRSGRKHHDDDGHHDGEHHDRHLLDHADGGDHGIEREHDVDDLDLHDHGGEARAHQDYHREQAEKVLAPAREMLDKLSIPYAVHIESGDRAKLITDAARRLHCDEIVMATARKNSLTRLVESSVTNRVLQLTSVPVEVIAGDLMSKWERYGIPAAIAAALVWAVVD